MSAVDRIIRPERASLREVWPSEPVHFTPWLGDNLEFLEEVLEFGRLTLLAKEKPIPGCLRALDLLVQTADGREVAIENQFGQVDHDHLTRGLAYAVGLGVAALVVIAERHADEFVAVADYLNRCADQLGDDGIRVFLVELTVEKVDQWYLPRFVSVARPNSWVTQVTATRPPSPGPGSLAMLTDQMPPGTAQFTRDLVATWDARPHCRVGFAPQAVALYRDNPARVGGGTTAVFAFHSDATARIYRGYLIDSGAFSGDAEVAELDAALARLFPTLRRTEQNYSPSLRPPIELDAVVGFGDFLDAWFDGLDARRTSVDAVLAAEAAPGVEAAPASVELPIVHVVDVVDGRG